MLRTQLALEGSAELFGPPGIITREFEAMKTGNKYAFHSSLELAPH